MLLKVVKHNGAHELFMNMYVVVVGQRYYYIDGVYCSSLLGSTSEGQCNIGHCLAQSEHHL